MQTLTAEEFKKKYGEVGISSFKTLVQPDKKGALSRVSKSISESLSQAKGQIQGTGEFSNQIAPQRGAELAATVTGLPVKAAISALPESVTKPIGKVVAAGMGGINWLAEKLGSQKAADWLVTNHPEVASGLENVAKTSGALAETTGNLLVAKSAVEGTKALASKLSSTPKITVGGKTLTLDDIHSPKGQQFVDTLPKDKQALVSAFDNKNSLLNQIGNAKKAGKDITDLKDVYESEFGKLPTTITEDIAQKTKDIFSGGKVKVADQVLPIPETVKTTLKRTSKEQLQSYIDQAKMAVIDQKAATPLEIAGDKAVDALNQVQSKLDTVGKLKASSIGSFGSKNVGTIATKFKQQIENFMKNKDFVTGDTQMVKSILDASKKLGNNPTAAQVDSFIDFAQDALYTGGKSLTVPVTSGTTGAIKNYLGQLNSSLKSQLPGSYSKLNDMYSNIIETRNGLNIALGADASKGGSLMKRVFSPTDGGTKKLFTDVFKETGIDLTDEAVLAKFAMDLFGDARQASILQQLSIPSQRGIIEKILQVGGKSIGLEDFIRNATIKRASKLIPKK